MAKICKKCGAQMDDHAIVCGYCGSPLETASGELRDEEEIHGSNEAPIKRFCGNCGKPLEEGALFCGYCGAPVKERNSSNPKQRKPHKAVRIAAILVCVFVLLGGTAWIVYQSTGFNGLLRTVMKSYVDYDIDHILDVASDFYYMGEEAAARDYFESVVGSGLDILEGKVGQNAQFSYEVNEIYEMSKRNLEDKLDTIKMLNKDYDVDEIKKIVIASTTVTANKGKQTGKITIDIIMCKEGNKYRLLDIEG